MNKIIFRLGRRQQIIGRVKEHILSTGRGLDGCCSQVLTPILRTTAPSNGGTKLLPRTPRCPGDGVVTPAHLSWTTASLIRARPKMGSLIGCRKWIKTATRSEEGRRPSGYVVEPAVARSTLERARVCTTARQPRCLTTTCYSMQHEGVFFQGGKAGAHTRMPR